MSLRARLLAVSAVLVVAGLLVADIATYRALSSSLLRRVDEQLIEAAHAAPGLLEHGDHGPGGPGPGDVSVPPGTYAELRGADGSVLASVTFGFQGLVYPTPALGDLPQHGEPFTVDAAEGSTRFRALAEQTPEGNTVVVAVPLTEVANTLTRLLAVELIVGVVVAGLVAGLAWWLVGVGLRPLEAIGETAGSIAAGDLSRRVSPADDRTEVGRLGTSLNTMLERIEEAFEERRASEARLRRFIADASHELRTPLTSIRGYAELFRRGARDEPEDLETSMARIEAEAERMSDLVDELLLLARLDQGRPLESEPVDLSAIADDAVHAARATDPGWPIGVSVEGDVTVVGDPNRLRQALDGLLDNVRVHAPASTPVAIAIARTDGRVRITVADEGPGLAPEDVGRVFERFYRGDPSRSRSTGGSGLGLSVAAAIIEAHGGTIEAANGPSGGAVFTIDIPDRPAS